MNERRLQVEKPRCRWELSVKVSLIAVGWAYVDWIYLILESDRWRALVDTVINREMRGIS